MKVLQVRVTGEEMRRLKRAALEEGMTVSGLVRGWISELGARPSLEVPSPNGFERAAAELKARGVTEVDARADLERFAKGVKRGSLSRSPAEVEELQKNLQKGSYGQKRGKAKR